jgi:hypothetical protein
MTEVAEKVAEKVMGQFPIDELCFILAAGLLTTMTFPFDIIRLLSSSANINWTELPSIISNFKPFVNLLYVLTSEHVAELFVVLLLSSIPVGIMIYLSLAVYEKANDSLGRFLKYYTGHPKRLVLRMLGITSEKKPNEAEEPSVSNSNDPNDKFETSNSARVICRNLKFSEWLRAKKVDRYFLFLRTMRSVSTTLLYGSETFWLLAVLSAVLPLLWLHVSIDIWLWVAYSAFIVVVIYLFFYAPFQTIYETSHSKILEAWKVELSSTDEAYLV